MQEGRHVIDLFAIRFTEVHYLNLRGKSHLIFLRLASINIYIYFDDVGQALMYSLEVQNSIRMQKKSVVLSAQLL